MKTVPRQVPEFTEKDKARFWAKVDKRPDGIWAWTSAKGRMGYGVFRIQYRTIHAHRIAWVLNERSEGRSGIICDTDRVLHKNDVTPDVCDVNPDNLWIGTMKENTLDMMRKGRGNYPTGDQSSSRLHPECVKRGEEHCRAKLCESDVRRIRILKRRGYTLRNIGLMFSVTHGTILALIKRRSWKHIL